jgi:alpha-1,6-mannosyltransferase
MKPPSTVDPAAPPNPTAGRSRSAGSSAAADPPVAASAAGEAPPRSRRGWFGAPPRGPLLIGLTASLLMVVGGFGAGGVLVRDPLLTNSVIGFWRYGHGRELAGWMIYIGVGLMAWAWIRLGREVLADRVRGRAVLTTALVWIAPTLFSAPLFTRDVFSYLAQGALPLAGLDPYAVGPEAISGILTDNVHYFWQDTPAPYGPLFILLAKSVSWLVGDNIILGVILMRLALLPGLVLFIWALPELTRRLGGRVSVSLWVAVANPMMVIHMIGGGHNDLLVMGLLAAGALVALRGAPVGGIVLVTMAMAIKASAAVALPFLVLVWAGQLAGPLRSRIARATAAGIAVFAAVFAACTVAAGVGLGWLPALSAPSMIVNWMSFPTGVGEFLHTVVNSVVPVAKQPFINVARIVGAALLLWIACRHWWASREGGPDAVRRAGLVLLAVAVLSPAMLPWYASWGMALLAAAPWTRPKLVFATFISLMLVIVYYPNGEDALYNFPYLFGCGLLALLAAISLVYPDPLHLGAHRRRAPATESQLTESQLTDSQLTDSQLTERPATEHPGSQPTAVVPTEPAAPPPDAAGAESRAG